MSDAEPDSRTPHQRVTDWFRGRGWTAFQFQKRVWKAYRDGKSGLVHATTGMGKTYSAWFAPLLEFMEEERKAERRRKKKPTKAEHKPPPLRVLWITPLRALAADTENALATPVEELGINWRVERRTGDTAAKIKNRQRKSLPTALVTTPESLTLLLTRPDAEEQFRELGMVVLDEWHELLGSKRGTQVELALARLRRWRPELRTWGLSATLGNLDEALDTLLGGPRDKSEREGVIITGRQQKRYRIKSVLPKEIERFPWAGHLGLRLLEPITELIEDADTTLLFTNTRSQTERWYQELLRVRPDWAGQIALHHGSLAREVRDWVEDGLRLGSLKCVVCTSSLDLGVDFSPVDRVVQVGSPKGVGRLLQRAGRSGHSPGLPSVVHCVPTNALELIEVAAVREAFERGRIEARHPLPKPLDCLVQHAVTIAVGGGFERDELLREIRQTQAYHDLTEEEWDWVLDFVVRGGESLRAYDDYHRVTLHEGRYVVDKKQIARRHRLSIGTIVDETSLPVQYLKGGRIGTVEETFIAKLKRGDVFVLGGKLLELVQVRDNRVFVKRAKGRASSIPRWMGGRMSLSNELGASLRQQLADAKAGRFESPELRAVEPLLKLQGRWSHIPGEDELLLEQIKTRDGYHLFVFPFEGRMVHEGLAALVAYRLAQLEPITFTMAINDYGFELLSADPPPLDHALASGDLFSPEHLAEDIAGGLNETEMAKRQFREVARIAGLVFSGYPGQSKTARQLQVSTGLLFDVFENYDPNNLLLQQAKREVLERQLEQTRLHQALLRLQSITLLRSEPKRPTPLAFPLMVDRLRERLTSERLADRVMKMTMQLETAADDEAEVKPKRRRRHS